MKKRKEPLIFYYIDKISEYSVAILLGIMVVVIFLQVFFRFVIRGSLSWSEELSRYLMIYAMFIAAAIGVKENSHMGVDYFVTIMPGKSKKFIKIISKLVSFIFSVALTLLSTKFVLFIRNTGQTSAAMEVPMWIVYLPLILGSLLMAINFCRVGYNIYKEEGVQQVD